MFNEATLEAAIMQLFEDKEKYTHKLGEQLHKNLAEVLLVEDIESYLMSRYADITEGEIQRVVLILKAQQTQSLYEENKRVLNMIVEGFPLKRDDASKPALWIRLIDFENPTKNDFKIVNQVEIVEVCNRRPDAIVYVNGLPLVVMEFKSAVKEHCTIKDAYTQLTVRYRKDIPSLFRYNAFVVISDGAQNKFGSLFTPYEYFYAWKRVEAADSPSDGIDSLFTMVSTNDHTVSTGNRWKSDIVNNQMQTIAKCKGLLSVVVGGLKRAITHYANENNIPFAWQTRFHDRIIRNQDEFDKISDYIEKNVVNWRCRDGVHVKCRDGVHTVSTGESK